MKKENWRPIKGYEGLYEVSFFGKVRNCNTGKMVPEYIKNKRKSHTIYVPLKKDNTTKECSLARIVYMSFIGELNDDEVVTHKNEITTDNIASNLVKITTKDFGKTRLTKINKKSVIKLDLDGNIVEIYPSAIKCAKENFYSYHAFLNRLNGFVKNVTTEGYDYAWEDSKASIDKAMKRIEKYKNSHGEKNWRKVK